MNSNNKVNSDQYIPSYYLVPDKKSWLAKRIEGIGASEIDAVLGLHKYTKMEQILDRKLGIKELFSKESINRMNQGTIREEEIINLYRDLTGLKVESLTLKDKIYYNPESPFLFASLDGIVTREDGSQYIIDAKLSNARFWNDNDAGYYYGQAQQQMYVMGLDYHEFAVLSPNIENPGPKDLKIIPVSRSEDFIKTMIEMGREFWDLVESSRNDKLNVSF